jgi:hypothetical protein
MSHSIPSKSSQPAVGRWVHILILVTFAGAAALSLAFFPLLWKDQATGWGSFGVFATLAALCSAIYEIIRGSSAAEMAETKSKEAIDRIKEINGILNSMDCKFLIEISISEIKRGERANLSNMIKILSHYRKSNIMHGVSDAELYKSNCDIMTSHISGNSKLSVNAQRVMCEALSSIYQHVVDVEKAPEGANAP